MDHHCPWIANCVGLKNQKSFILFLFYATVGDFIVFAVLARKSYYAMYNLLYYPRVFAIGKQINKSQNLLQQFLILFWEPFTCFIGAILGLAMTLAIGFLLIHQIQMIRKNITGIEYHKYNKEEDSPWYSENYMFNISTVMGLNSRWKWFIPNYESNQRN